MKISTRFIFRKMKTHLGQMLGMGILIFVASLFFTTIFSFVNTFEERTEAYFKETNYADISLTGSFAEDDLAKVESLSGVTVVQGRWVQDYKQDDKIIRLHSLTSEVNQLQVTKGRLPQSKSECVILTQYAREKQTKVGDDLAVDHKKLKIVGLVHSPEYVYYVQSARTMFADMNKFVVAFVSENYFSGYNQLLIGTSGKVTETQLASQVAFTQLTSKKDQINYQMYAGDLDQFEAFAYIFPTIFWLMSFSIIFILLRRTILKEHKQIGIMKALGHKNSTIIKIYLMQFGFLGLIASILGCGASFFVFQWLIEIIKAMIEVPDLSFHFYWGVWLFCVGMSIAGCLLSGLLSMLDVVNELPTASMKPKMPKSRKQILLERFNFIWQKFSFNTRYALKSTLRNKGRFVVMLVGIIASTALLVFAFGFNDSIRHVNRQYFEDFAEYDLLVESDFLPWEANPLTNYAEIEHQDKALQLAVKVKGEDYPLLIVNQKLQTLKLPAKALKRGIVIPEYYAEKWGVAVGDEIEIADSVVEVSDIIHLSMGLSIFTSFDYADQIFTDLPQGYNTTYVQAENSKKLEQQLEQDGVVYSTAEDDSTTFDTLLDNLRALILLLIICGVVLGITVILCINLMNLTVREFEYMFMNIMGYSKGKILEAITKETVIQLLLALPIGFAVGYQLINGIKGEFSQNTFALYPEVSLQSYLVSGLIVLLMSSSRILTANRYIDKLDIVEGLKVQDD